MAYNLDTIKEFLKKLFVFVLAFIFEKILMEHIAYVVKKEARTNREKNDNQLDEISEKIRSKIGFILGHDQNDDVSMEVKVRNLLIGINSILGGSFYSNFLEEWYKSIYLYSNVETVNVEKDIYILKNYNEFIKKINNSIESPIES